jgi:ATP-dependent Clp protease, protease subunit
MDAAVQAEDPRHPGRPPEVPFPERPGPTRPIFPPVPGRPVPSPSPGPGVPGVPAVPGVPGLLFPPGDQRPQVYDDLLARRMVVLDRALDDEAATLVAAQLVALDQAGGEPITLVVVNSAGGPMAAASAVLDTMDLVRAPVGTMCLGRAEGTAVVVAATGTGLRRIGAGARLRLRLADLDLRGPAQRLDHELAYHRELQATLVDRLAAVTGQERRLVERDVDAGRAFTAAEAVAYGLADEIVGAPRG